MSTARDIVALIGKHGPAAVTLRYGYAASPKRPQISFEPGNITRERRDDAGRTSYLRSTYKDGSSIVFTHSATHGSRWQVLDAKGVIETGVTL